jgi:hypothetical protein
MPMKPSRWIVKALAALVCVAAPAAAYDFPALMRPLPATARFTEPGFIVWCGSLVRDEAGTYHLFYSRWPEKLGHYAWVTHSEIARATSKHPLGPYRPAGVVLPARGREFWDGLCTHNPTIMRFGDKYFLYYMGNTGDGKASKSLNWTHRNNQRIGVASAPTPAGPWTRLDRPLVEPTPGFHDATATSNPSVTRRPQGDYLMVYKAIGDKRPGPFYGPVVHVAATAPSPAGPFAKHPAAIFTAAGSDFPAEDPFIWRGPDRYWAIVKDFKGHFTKAGPSLALFESADGLAWAPAAKPLVSRIELAWEDGTRSKLMKLERPQILLEDGRPTVLACAAAPVGNLDASFIALIPLAPPP